MKHGTNKKQVLLTDVTKVVSSKINAISDEVLASNVDNDVSTCSVHNDFAEKVYEYKKVKL